MKCAKLAGDVEKDKAPSGEGERAVATGEGLAALGDDVRRAGAVELVCVERVTRHLAVRPAPVHEVRSKSESKFYNYIVKFSAATKVIIVTRFVLIWLKR